MSETNPTVNLQMVKNAEGILVPADTIKPKCTHTEVATRFGEGVVKQRHQYICQQESAEGQRCLEQVVVRIMNYVVLHVDDLENFERGLQLQGQLAQAEAKRRQSGIVLPGEAKQG